MTHKTLKVYSPYDLSEIGEVPMAGPDDIERMLQTAHDLASDPDKRIPVPEIKKILHRTIEIIKDRYDSFVHDSVLEGGKPLLDTRIEVDRALQGIGVAIESMSQVDGEKITMNQTASSSHRLAFTIREPIGVVAAVSAFNHPVNLIIHQVIPAVATGCPVIVKPASTTPMSCFNVVRALYDAGLPPEWAQVVVCDRDLASKLVTDRRVAFLTFIGSGEVGWALRSKLAPGTRCAMEHGGVAPVIFERDGDIENALPLLAKGGFYHAGQVCVSVQRVYVHEKVADELVSGLTDIASKLVVGDPLEEATEVGPLILPSEVERVEGWVNEASGAGGKILCGGKRLSDTCYGPTVILDPPDDVRVSTMEVFGPVVCVYRYKDRLDAIRRANSLRYSFQASVFTKDIDIALDTSRRLNASAVMINDHTAFRVDWMPFGGRMESGIGTGGIPWSMKDMTEEKLVVIKSPGI